MDSTRFIRRLEEIEGRLNPAPMSPDAIFAAQTFARYDAQLVPSGRWTTRPPPTPSGIRP